MHACIYACIQTYKQTDRPTDRQTDIHTAGPTTLRCRKRFLHLRTWNQYYQCQQQARVELPYSRVKVNMYAHIWGLRQGKCTSNLQNHRSNQHKPTCLNLPWGAIQSSKSTILGLDSKLKKRSQINCSRTCWNNHQFPTLCQTHPKYDFVYSIQPPVPLVQTAVARSSLFNIYRRTNNNPQQLFENNAMSYCLW